MIYSDFNGMRLSMLGFGGMRLPVIDGRDANVNEKAVYDMVDYAMESGINYYDTAWGYHGGNSEKIVGEALSKYPRDSFYLATKFPGYDLNNMDKVGEIFEEQLKRCKVDYFDFYLIHNVCEANINQYLDPKYGIYDYLTRQKENGRIHHLGFSVHAPLDVMRRFIDAYGDGMEFGQIQLNYIDWIFQQAKEKVDMLKEYNLLIWVMEPVRGGKLAALDKKYSDRLKKLRPDEDIPAWAFRFIQSIDGIKVILSGMSNMDQLRDNIQIFEENLPLNEKETKELLAIADEIIKSNILPCTACRYCTSYCPKQLDIPYLLSLYNEHTITGGGFIAPMALSALPKDKRPRDCIACRSCEAVCPQQIKISEVMTDFTERLKSN